MFKLQLQPQTLKQSLKIISFLDLRSVYHLFFKNDQKLRKSTSLCLPKKEENNILSERQIQFRFPNIILRDSRTLFTPQKNTDNQNSTSCDLSIFGFPCVA